MRGCMRGDDIQSEVIRKHLEEDNNSKDEKSLLERGCVRRVSTRIYLPCVVLTV